MALKVGISPSKVHEFLGQCAIVSRFLFFIFIFYKFSYLPIDRGFVKVIRKLLPSYVSEQFRMVDRNIRRTWPQHRMSPPNQEPNIQNYGCRSKLSTVSHVPKLATCWNFFPVLVTTQAKLKVFLNAWKKKKSSSDCYANYPNLILITAFYLFLFIFILSVLHR